MNEKDSGRADSAEDSSSDDIKHRKVSVASFTPMRWANDGGEYSVWISVHRTFRTNLVSSASVPIQVDLGDVVAVILNATVEFVRVTLDVEVVDDQLVLTTGSAHDRAREGVYLVMLTPLSLGEGREVAARQKIDAAVGLFLAVNGRNVAYDRVFEGIQTIPSGDLTVASPSIENPLALPVPDLSDDGVRVIRSLGESINQLPDSDRNRVDLSLRWFESATFVSGIDSYLRYWIALETLSMPSGTNIRPINESLGRAYGIDTNSAARRFHVGRLFDLRGAIVHGGQRLPIHGETLNYISAIYVDVLFVTLGLNSTLRAQRCLDEGRFDPSRLPRRR